MQEVLIVIFITWKKESTFLYLVSLAQSYRQRSFPQAGYFNIPELKERKNSRFVVETKDRSVLFNHSGGTRSHSSYGRLSPGVLPFPNFHAFSSNSSRIALLLIYEQTAPVLKMDHQYFRVISINHFLLAQMLC